MPKQPAFPGLRDAMKKKQTRRERFLAEMGAVVPWARLLALIVPQCPKAGPKAVLRCPWRYEPGQKSIRGIDFPAIGCGCISCRTVCAQRSDGGGFKREAIDPVDRL